jgi:hypothetical protein
MMINTGQTPVIQNTTNGREEVTIGDMEIIEGTRTRVIKAMAVVIRTRVIKVMAVVIRTRVIKVMEAVIRTKVMGVMVVDIRSKAMVVDMIRGMENMVDIKTMQ